VFKFATSSNEAAGNKEKEFWFFFVNDRSVFNISVTGVFVDVWKAETNVPAFVSTRVDSCPVVGKLPACVNWSNFRSVRFESGLIVLPTHGRRWLA
jgi:hypothetical protein